jgi:hypothetical protein
VLGIPLIPIAMLLFFAAKLMSLAAFGALLSEKFHDSLQRPSPTPLRAAAIGYLLLTSLWVIGKLMALAGGIGSFVGGMLVLANMMILCCAVVVGLGAVWTTRMGSRKEGIC